MNLPRPRQRHHSMLTLGDDAPPRSRSGAVAEKQNKLRRRKSSAMVLLEMEAPESRRQSEYFTSVGRFTLKDLAAVQFTIPEPGDCCRCPWQGNSCNLCYCNIASFVSTRLLVVFYDPESDKSFQSQSSLRRLPQPRLLLDDDEEETFVYPNADDDDPIISTPSGPVFIQPDTTYSTHEREMGLYLTLVSRVDPSHNEDAFSTGYDYYLRDALFSIQNQTCFYLDIDPQSRAKSKHRLNANDPILSLILESLRRFFSNTILKV